MKKIIIKYNIVLDEFYRIRTPAAFERTQFCGNCILSRSLTRLKDGCKYLKVHQFFMNQNVINHCAK